MATEIYYNTIASFPDPTQLFCLHVERVHPRSLHVERVQPQSLHVERVQPQSLHVERVQPQSSHVERVQPQSLQEREGMRLTNGQPNITKVYVHDRLLSWIKGRTCDHPKTCPI